MSSRKRSKVFRALALVMQFGINMLVPIFLLTMVGVFIYRRTGTAIPLLILFFIGALAGFRNCYIQARKVYEDSDEKNKEP